MKSFKTFVTGAVTLLFLCGVAIAAQTPAKKLTCCQEANAQGKECAHKCCIAAHKRGESCVKCNPNKEDLALKKKDGKAGKKALNGR